MNVIDEMQYIIGVKNGLSSTAYPSPAFFIIYKYLENSNLNLIFSARLLNLTFLLLTLIPVYLISDKFNNKTSTKFTLLYTLFSPFSWYVNNFMPEILFGFVFYCFAYFVIVRENINKPLNYLIISILLNLLIAVKNHGIFIFISFFIYFLYYIQKNKLSYSNLILFLICFIIQKLLIDNYFYGESNIFNKIYLNILNNQNKSFDIFIIFNKLIISFIGHILYFSSVYFLLLVMIVNKAIDNYNINLIYFSIINYAILISITVIFSVIVSESPSESIFRIHSRYYSFLNPLLVICVLNLLKNIYVINTSNLLLKICFLNCFLFITAYFIINKFYMLSYIDNPELTYIYTKYNIFWFIILNIFILRIKIKKFEQLFYIYLIWILINSIYLSHINYGSRKIDTPPDAAGKYLCNIYQKVDQKINIYVDNVVSLGFLYYNCQLNYSVKYFNDFDGIFESNTYYIGNYVYKNDKFINLDKINETIYYAK